MAGAVVARFGIRATFVCNIAVAALGFVPTLLLPIGSLREQRPPEATNGPPETGSEKLHAHGSLIDVYADSAAHSPVSACTAPATPPAGASATADRCADAEAGEAGHRSQGEAGTGHERLEETVYDVAAHVPLVSAPELLVPSFAGSAAGSACLLHACRRPAAALCERSVATGCRTLRSWPCMCVAVLFMSVPHLTCASCRCMIFTQPPGEQQTRKGMRLLLSSSRPYARPRQSEALDSRALTLPPRTALLIWSSPCCRQSLQRWACRHQNMHLPVDLQ